MTETGRHVVFLQGMPCAFFKDVATRLREAGLRTTRINLCTGDALFWRGPDAVNYRGTYKNWPDFIAGFFERERVTDLVLLGEQRYYHREAVEAAKARSITVTVTDFGYLRPDWITFERDGMSGGSHFPRDPAAIRRLAKGLPEPDWTAQYADGGVRMACGDLLHNFANVLLGWLYPFYRRSDRRPHTLLYTASCAVRLYANRRLREAAELFVKDISTSGARYYVFPLQLNFDFQIIAYSDFDGVGDAIRMVLASFARHAPEDAQLVLKEHPWDPALVQWQTLMSEIAATLGISGRVHYLRGGNLDDLIRGASGVVTVNSTSGIRALQLGRPLKVLGQAVFDIPGISFQGTLDAFWSDGTIPDAELVRDFLLALSHTVQIRGTFFGKAGLTAAVNSAAWRLVNNRVGELEIEGRKLTPHEHPALMVPQHDAI
jgi:capsular polysaccharide export protein